MFIYATYYAQTPSAYTSAFPAPSAANASHFQSHQPQQNRVYLQTQANTHTQFFCDNFQPLTTAAYQAMRDEAEKNNIHHLRAHNKTLQDKIENQSNLISSLQNDNKELREIIANLQRQLSNQHAVEKTTFLEIDPDKNNESPTVFLELKSQGEQNEIVKKVEVQSPQRGAGKVSQYNPESPPSKVCEAKAMTQKEIRDNKINGAKKPLKKLKPQPKAQNIAHHTTNQFAKKPTPVQNMPRQNPPIPYPVLLLKPSNCNVVVGYNRGNNGMYKNVF